MGILDNLYKHSMVHPDVANAYIDGKDIPEIILKNEVPNPEFLEAIGEIGSKYADITLVQTENGTISADSTHIALPGKVTLTATPSEGYQVSKWQVSTDGTTWTDINIEEISTSADEDSVILEYNLTEPGTYSFKVLFEQVAVSYKIELRVEDDMPIDTDQLMESTYSENIHWEGGDGDPYTGIGYTEESNSIIIRVPDNVGEYSFSSMTCSDGSLSIDLNQISGDLTQDIVIYLYYNRP